MKWNNFYILQVISNGLGYKLNEKLEKQDLLI